MKRMEKIINITLINSVRRGDLMGDCTKENMRTFSKESTLITKGIFIILLLTHHLFYDAGIIEYYGVSTLISDVDFASDFITYARICIAGFAFLSAFGITRALKAKTQLLSEAGKKSKLYAQTVFRRIVKLESGAWFAFVVAMLYRKFVLGESVKLLYVGAENRFEPLYMLIDMCGLSTYFGTPYMNVTWWYLSFALLLIVSMPVLFALYEKHRLALLPVGLLLPVVIFNGNVYFASLLPVIIVGIAFAYEDWFEKLENMAANWRWRVLQLVVCIALIILSFELCNKVNEIYMYPFAFVFAYISYMYLSRIPVLSHVLKFIGEHATNIFLIHTLIYYYFYSDFIYSFGYSWAIVMVLLIISLIVSIIIELLKKVTGYNWVIKKVVDKVESL